MIPNRNPYNLFSSLVTAFKNFIYEKEDYSQNKLLFFLFLSSCVLFNNFLLGELSQWWFSTGQYCQAKWDGFLDYYGEEPFFYWFFVTWFVVVASYCMLGGLFAIFDYTGKPEFMRKYKIQKDKPPITDPEKLKLLFVRVSINLFIFAPLMIGIQWVMMDFWGRMPLRQLPSLHIVLCQFVFMLMIVEIGWYYTHRIFHHPQLYARIHKIHHEWKSPMALSAIYAHPIEFMCGNLAPIGLGAILVYAHVVTVWFWYFFMVSFTINEHCGYDLPFFGTDDMHDFHHQRFNQNYSAFGFLDYLHGTNHEYIAFKEYQRKMNSKNDFESDSDLKKKIKNNNNNINNNNNNKYLKNKNK